LGNLESNSSLLNYYEATGAPKAAEMLQTARRLFAAGQTDYTELLRNSNEAYSIQLRRLEALYNYNVAILTLQYLTGTP
jgi:outer membrane protein TolC